MLPSNLTFLTARELEQALAIANRGQRRSEMVRVVKEFRRRKVRISNRTFYWTRQTFGRVG